MLPRTTLHGACGKTISRRQPHLLCKSTQTAVPPTLPAIIDTRPKVSFVGLGCAKNLVDGEVMLGDLQRSGFQIVTEHEDADAIVINTCAFIEDAKSESLEAIMDASNLNDDGKKRKLIITGCLAQRYSNQLAADLPEADLVVGFENYGTLAASLQAKMGLPVTATAATATPSGSGSSADGVLVADPARVQVGSATVPFRPEWDRVRLTPPHTAYLRVAEGCNHACTFCAIPGFRGKFRSKPWQALLDEAKHLVESGVREINLIAEDTNQYGQDRRDGRDLALLMRELGKLEGLHWMRILYAYPSYFTDELIDEIATNPKVAKYIDIPLQHINNLVLLSMNRPPQDHTQKLLFKLRERIPDLVLRTTFISGFPGETAAQHAELVTFAKTFKFERMGCFAYSEEDGTPAATFPDQVPQKLRERRRDELNGLQQRTGETFAASLVGREVDVLIDGYNEDGLLIGRTQWDAPDVDPLVFLTEPMNSTVPPMEVGQVRRCVIDGNSLFDLEAHPIS
mmetsp:Transcript_19009/g.32522  ORF Transcript_19009/g.32522 Transcript_19009/m.32522 type:complete len:512 (-) Transcript_19009:594-2129(-)|eukprot:CAMPEP_0119108444 /NCGR_PEP_ID=MMETSP1180-20130426/14424_1 /TAXON_ID=3052 ORGANISM="Chlamydomonas cf sp, Strain CCMP681" /NCGR_SAMPLE_ID=MMETSP1180 /ASSEMBLY_ACC=CAM_ASM_000741 /LENGTH=511 /DNA_ID=CAMNT_0007094055 /DNA_START=69 /DNA_END=1604 /DNA_ORIENTATION=-